MLVDGNSHMLLIREETGPPDAQVGGGFTDYRLMSSESPLKHMELTGVHSDTVI